MYTPVFTLLYYTMNTGLHKSPFAKKNGNGGRRSPDAPLWVYLSYVSVNGCDQLPRLLKLS